MEEHGAAAIDHWIDCPHLAIGNGEVADCLRNDHWMLLLAVEMWTATTEGRKQDSCLAFVVDKQLRLKPCAS